MTSRSPYRSRAKNHFHCVPRRQKEEQGGSENITRLMQGGRPTGNSRRTIHSSHRDGERREMTGNDLRGQYSHEVIATWDKEIKEDACGHLRERRRAFSPPLRKSRKERRTAREFFIPGRRPAVWYAGTSQESSNGENEEKEMSSFALAFL